VGKFIPAKMAMTPETKCGYCSNAKCCQYITHPIDTPRSKADFDYLLWQVSHSNISCFKDEDGWFLKITASCTHLSPNGRCGIYTTRPQICRDHSNDYCEFDHPLEESFDNYFPDYNSLLKYCQNRFATWGASK
jgi:Fe-S-cluster containining protein